MSGRLVQDQFHHCGLVTFCDGDGVRLEAQGHGGCRVDDGIAPGSAGRDQGHRLAVVFSVAVHGRNQGQGVPVGLGVPGDGDGGSGAVEFVAGDAFGDHAPDATDQPVVGFPGGGVRVAVGDGKVDDLARDRRPAQRQVEGDPTVLGDVGGDAGPGVHQLPGDRRRLLGAEYRRKRHEPQGIRLWSGLAQAQANPAGFRESRFAGPAAQDEGHASHHRGRAVVVAARPGIAVAGIRVVGAGFPVDGGVAVP